MHNRYVVSAARAVLYAFSFVFLEWLFLVTKPSFLVTWLVSERISGLFASAVPFILGALALHAIACIAAALLARFGRERVANGLLRLVPALIAAAIVLMLVDNFTYTVFGWGIVRSTWTTAPLYWLLLVAVVVVVLRRRPSDARWRVPLAAAILVASGVAVAWSLQTGDSIGGIDYSGARAQRLPNIILFASDGVNADYMSAYGYEHTTTPHLDSYLDQAMVVDNAFTNSAWTTGSLTAMLTGKYATTTKVLYPPYTLQGRDSYESLPRILRQLGYRTAQETVRYYADGPDLNFEGAFDQANGRDVDVSDPGRFSMALQRPAMLVRNASKRLSERLLHLAFVRRMEDPYAEVAPKDIGPVKKTSDEERMALAEQVINDPHQPFFIHIHLLGTHCCKYHPDKRVFSTGTFPDKASLNQAEFEDAILQSDRYFGQMMDALRRAGRLDNTIVVYSSDHNTHWEVRARVPLIFIFPKGDHRGHVPGNSQLIDVAPTLLDYLGVDIPKWMEGGSLLNGGFKRERPIFSIYKMDKSKFRTHENEFLGRVNHLGPPTYGLKSAGMVVCQRWYIMTLKNSKVKSGSMAHYRDKCARDSLPTKKQAAEMMSAHLRARGFKF
jgi:arylsulfatase A-like enzyme